ncbi:acetolactate synthase 2 small subunit [Ferrimonas balearica]|uniref:acetolactate synthase 2 small subunit n=1 Tax=Ferrimonas balearica TaxID=44012 RepID=UPI001C99855B|nr:acetolactate synthase 2 small subunit [Ferrimonas balearica]MBY5993298.1 acetolactate synthase 2 small subunit [Ferrimonas balearica]
MSEHTLYIEMNPSADVLERVLRVTRHRGFTIRHMNMAQSGAHSQMAVTVSSERPIDQLTRQLDKLFDVTDCRIETACEAAPAAAANA